MCSSLSLKKTFAEGDGAHIRERHNMEYTMRRRRAQWLISRVFLPPPSAKVFLRNKGEYIALVQGLRLELRLNESNYAYVKIKQIILMLINQGVSWILNRLQPTLGVSLPCFFEYYIP